MNISVITFLSVILSSYKASSWICFWDFRKSEAYFYAIPVCWIAIVTISSSFLSPNETFLSMSPFIERHLQRISLSADKNAAIHAPPFSLSISLANLRFSYEWETAIATTSLSFLSSSETYWRHSPFWATACKTTSLSFWTSFYPYWRLFPFWATASKTTSLSFWSYFDAY